MHHPVLTVTAERAGTGVRGHRHNRPGDKPNWATPRRVFAPEGGDLRGGIKKFCIERKAQRARHGYRRPDVVLFAERMLCARKEEVSHRIMYSAFAEKSLRIYNQGYALFRQFSS